MTLAILGGLGLIFFLFRRRRRPEAVVEGIGGVPLQTVATGPEISGPKATRAPKTPRTPKATPKPAAKTRTKTPPVVAEVLPIVPPPPARRQEPVLPDTPDEEVNMPRWRRPSVQSARKAASRGMELPHVPVAFKDGATDVERRRIRYRLVRVSSIPDEIMGDEVARLDRGDEVEMIRSAGAYWLVRTPYGDEGWIHQMTLDTASAEPDDDTPLGAADTELPF
jgi:hypothetical protein